MKSCYVTIQLNNLLSSCYLPGDSLSGTVTLDFRKEVRIKGLAVQCVGKADVHWKEARRSGNHHYGAAEEYVNHLLQLIVNDGSKRICYPGRQLFNFQFDLPQILPSSFEGEHGAITYAINAILQTKHKQLVFSTPFTVNGILDLNLRANQLLAITPISVVRTEGVNRMLLLNGGSVSYTLNLPKTGYVPGEYVNINAEIYNQSHSTVRHTKLMLLQEVIYIGTYTPGFCEIFYSSVPLRIKHTTVVKTVRGPKVCKGEIKCWNGDVIEIPSTIPPTGLGGCEIITANYYLKFVLELPGAYLTVDNIFKIIVGTVPLHSTPSGMTREREYPTVADPLPSYSDAGEEYPVPRTSTLQTMPDQPPPSYIEAIQMQNFKSVSVPLSMHDGNGGAGRTTSDHTDADYFDETTEQCVPSYAI